MFQFIYKGVQKVLSLDIFCCAFDWKNIRGHSYGVLLMFSESEVSSVWLLG